VGATHRGLLHDLRRDPAHAGDTFVRYGVPLVAPHVEKWWANRESAETSQSRQQMARKVLRRSIHVARRGGILMGSSFYVGTVPAMAMVYCEQLVVILRIAALFGRDPRHPVRAAEILVIQGRYATLAEAAAALAGETDTSAESSAVRTRHRLLDFVKQVPGMIGLRVRTMRSRSIFDRVVGVVEVVAYFVPVLSMPIWAVANAHATRRLGQRAIDFYGQPAPALELGEPIVLPGRLSSRKRRLLIAAVIPLALAMGALLAVFPIGHARVSARWLALALGELALMLTFARLVRLTRVPAGVRV